MEQETPRPSPLPSRIALRMPSDLLRKVEAEAAQRGEPISMFVRNALRRELEAA